MSDAQAWKLATFDLIGIAAADVFFLLAPKQSRGAWVELGFAIGVEKAIAIVGPQCRDSIFTSFGTLLEDESEALEWLDQLLIIATEPKLRLVTSEES